jgi:hypothetical protein
MRVVTQAGGDLQIPAHLIFILEEPAEELFPNYDVTVAALLNERERASLDVVFERRE